jgi:hypothetical protein
MTQVSIGLNEAGRNKVSLSAGVGNDLQISWVLTDEQLAFLVARGVAILKSRAEFHALGAMSRRDELLSILGAV